MKYLFLDTNVFLHFRYYNEINWNEIIGDGEYTIVVASMVIEELDNKKYDVSRKISRRAKQMLSRFLEISDGSQRENFPVVIDSSRPNDTTFQVNNLKSSSQDDNILASIIEFNIDVTDEKYLISNDTGPKLKAKSLNIKAPNIPEKFLLEEEVDETEKELKNLKKELTELKNTIPKIALTFDNSEEFLRCNLKILTMSKVDYVESELAKKRVELPAIDENPYNMPSLLNSLNKISAEQRNRYNQELVKYFEEYRKYLETKYDYEKYLSFRFEVTLILNNTGSAPGEDIDINLHFPDGFELQSEYDLRKPPKTINIPYKPKSSWDFGPSLIPNLDFMYKNPSVEKKINTGFLTSKKKTNSYNVNYKIPLIKHNLPISLGKLYVCFSELEPVKNFQIDYELIIANVPKKIEGKLNMIFIGE